VQSAEEIKREPDMVIDCAGGIGTAALGLNILRPRGTLVLVGYRHESDIDFGLIARKELRIRGIRSGSPIHLRQALTAASERTIRVPPIDTWQLPDINQAIAQLRSGRVRGKAVITPVN
jgi:D-arabinose 1-dehydrogenase-like Zn-dependent alcohol dehydrogenase